MFKSHFSNGFSLFGRKNCTRYLQMHISSKLGGCKRNLKWSPKKRGSYEHPQYVKKVNLTMHTVIQIKHGIKSLPFCKHFLGKIPLDKMVFGLRPLEGMLHVDYADFFMDFASGFPYRFDAMYYMSTTKSCPIFADRLQRLRG